MTPEAKIPVYRREIAPGTNFTTFSSEGTTLLGWISGGPECISEPFGGSKPKAANFGDDAQVAFMENREVRYPMWRHISAEQALAYARAGMKGLRFEPASVKHDTQLIDGTGAKPPRGAMISFGPLGDQFLSKKFAETVAEYVKAASELGPQGGYPIPREIAEPFLAAIDAGQTVFFGKPFTFPEGYSDHLVKPDEQDEEPKPETWRDRKPLL